MAIYLLLIIFSIAFVEMFVLLRVSKDATTIITLSQECMRALVSSKIGDDEREVFVRHGAVEIFKSTCYFSVKLIMICLALSVIFLLGGTQFPDLRNAMLKGLVSPVVLLIVAVAIIVYASVRRVILSRL